MLIYGFYESCNNISSIYVKVGDYSMSVIYFWTMAKGNLHNFSYIYFKLELLGKEFKTVACSVTTTSVLIKVHRVN